MKNKKNIIFISLGVIILFVLILLIIQLVIKNNQEEQYVFVPDFMSNEEKNVLGIPEDKNIQVMGRDDNDEVTVYKIINPGEEAVDPSEVGPISPRAYINLE